MKSIIMISIVLAAGAALLLLPAGCGGEKGKAPEKAAQPAGKAGEGAKPAEPEGGHEGHEGMDMGSGMTPGGAAAGESSLKPQTVCPVMGGKIDKSVHVDYKGMRVYFCCDGCQGTFMKDPEKYLAKIRANGEEPERIE